MLYITGHCRPANDNRQFPEHCCAMLPVSIRKGKKIPGSPPGQPGTDDYITVTMGKEHPCINGLPTVRSVFKP